MMIGFIVAASLFRLAACITTIHVSSCHFLGSVCSHICVSSYVTGNSGFVEQMPEKPSPTTALVSGTHSIRWTLWLLRCKKKGRFE